MLLKSLTSGLIEVCSCYKGNELAPCPVGRDIFEEKIICLRVACKGWGWIESNEKCYCRKVGYSGIKQQCLWAQVTKYDIELGQGPPPPATSAHTPCELGKVEGGLSWYWALSQEPLSSEQWWSHLRTEVSFPTKGRCTQFGGVCVSNLLFWYPQ